ncbi:MAG: efflux RND transporter periplasmic adaptor subunit [Pseudomonadota bacterium]
MLVLAQWGALAEGTDAPGVIVATVQSIDMSAPDRFFGQIVSPSKVSLVPQIPGILTQRAVPDGSEVKKGDLLFAIDKDRFNAALAEAEANLASAQAAAATAQAVYDRASELAKRNTVAQAQLDSDEGALKEANALVKVREAEVTIAKLDVEHAEVHAPFDGRLGQWQEAVGALVGPGRDPVITLVALDPVRVTFPVRQRQLLKAHARYGERVKELVVALELADGSTYGQTGKVLFEEAQATAATDTVTVVAEIANPESVLRDSQLVTVVVRDPTPTKTLAISEAAVLLDRAGSYVFTVGADNTVARTEVTLGARKAGMVAVTDGLKAGDRVIVAGQQKVRPGETVAATEGPATANAGAAGSAAVSGN